MSRLLAAKIIALFQHSLQHISVANLGYLTAYAFFFDDDDFNYDSKGSKIWHYMQAVH